MSKGETTVDPGSMGTGGNVDSKGLKGGSLVVCHVNI